MAQPRLNLSVIAKRFSDESDAYQFLESVLWRDGVVCPHCHSVNQSKFLTPRNGERKTRNGTKSHRRVWQCDVCNQQFSVLVGTIFEDSHIPISKWLIAIHEMCAAKNGVSALELSRMLGISYRPAWHMAHRIRLAITQTPLTEMFTGTMEADETYMGGEAKNMLKSKREQKIKGRGTTGKTPVLSIVERGGEVRSQVLENVDSTTLRDSLEANVDSQAVLMTDTHPAYVKAAKKFSKHETVDHSAGEYARGNAHINTVEGHFSQLKRSINGTYHHVSEKHLPRYPAEFDYRYSTRKSKDGERMLRAIGQSTGKRLMYKDAIKRRR